MIKNQLSNDFEDATFLQSVGAGVFIAQTHNRFQTGAGPFGGWSLAIALKAVLMQSDISEPLAINAQFHAPIPVGDVQVRTTITHRGKRSENWRVELGPPNATCLTVLIFSTHRRPEFSDQELTMPLVNSPEDLPSLDPESFKGAWVSAFDLRHAEGALLMSGASSSSVVWTRFNDDASLNYPRLATLCDTAIARIYYRLERRVPIATVGFSAHFHAGIETLREVGNDFVLVVARARGFSGGFHDQTLAIFSRSGQLLATSEQSVWYKTSNI